MTASEYKRALMAVIICGTSAAKNGIIPQQLEGFQDFFRPFFDQLAYQTFGGPAEDFFALAALPKVTDAVREAFTV